MLGVIGCGNVGYAFLHWLNKQGYNVLGFDKDERVQARIKEELGEGSCAISLDQLCDCDGIFICVPTEPNADGSADMSIYESVIKELALLFGDNRKIAVIQRSTCPPGSADRYASMFADNVSYAVNPSFLRKSSIGYDTENPDRVAIGGTGYAKKLLQDVYSNVDAPRLITDSRKTVELLKYIENTLDTMLITYWNSIMEFSVALNIGVDDFELLVEHIGDKDKFKNPARVPGKAFGLWCLPKDLRALIYEMNEAELDSSLFSAIDSINQRFDAMIGTGHSAAQELIMLKSGNAKILPKGDEQIREAFDLLGKQ